jgi:hypothetical protein
MLKQTVVDFCKKYSVNVLDTNKRAPIRTTTFFVEPSDKNVMTHDTTRFDTEPLVTLAIPLSKLGAMVNIEATFFNNIDNVGHRRVFDSWIQQQEKERQLRHKYEAVNLAYKQYSAMLAWCESGKNPTDFKPLPDET